MGRDAGAGAGWAHQGVNVDVWTWRGGEGGAIAVGRDAGAGAGRAHQGVNGEGCVELEGGQKQWDETLVLVLAGLTKV